MAATVSTAVDLLQKSASLDEGVQDFTPRSLMLHKDIDACFVCKSESCCKKHHFAKQLAQASSTLFFIMTLFTYAVTAFGMMIIASGVARVAPSTSPAFEKVFDAMTPSDDCTLCCDSEVECPKACSKDRSTTCEGGSDKGNEVDEKCQ